MEQIYASAYVLFEFPYNADKILRKRRLVAQSVTLARRAKVPDEIDDLDDVVHHLFPHLAIKIDFLKKKTPIQPKVLSERRRREKNNNNNNVNLQP
jgi:hypothetical protein